MTTIHLIRHGQTNWNVERRIQGQTESSLTPTGVEQARQVARELKDIHFDRAYASSSRRARDTARYILEQHEGVDLELRDDLREIFLGSWEGQLYAEVKESHPEHHGHFWEDPASFALEGAESFHDLQMRAVKTIEDIADANPGKSLLVVSHGAYIKALLCHYEGRHLSNFWQPPHMRNCCHSVLERNADRQFEIRRYAGLAEW